MDGELLDVIVSWRSFLVALLVFGFAPGALLRLIVLAFRRDDPRRRELLAELHAVPHHLRPLWVVEQLEVALFEGVGERVTRLIRRTTREVSDLAFLGLEKRVLKKLLELDTTPEGIRITQAELASMVGGSRRAVNQVLESLSKQGYIRIAGQTIETNYR
jgi:CRP-like cAMP-binding protein